MTERDDFWRRILLSVDVDAHDEYDEDPLAAILEHLGDAQRDLGFESDEFRSGFRHAKHLVTCQYITYSGEFECSCPNGRPAAERRKEAWRCGMCDAYLAEPWEVPGARGDDI